MKPVQDVKVERQLYKWGIALLDGKGPILAGDENGLLRTSTPLVKFDAYSLTATTASGRPYRLLGRADDWTALEAIRVLWGVGSAHVELMSPEQCERRLAEQPNAPFEHAPDEQRRLDGLRRRSLWSDIRWHAVVSGMSEEDLSRLSGLPLDVLRRLGSDREASLDGISIDEAEEALRRIVNRSAAEEGEDEGMKP